MKVKRSDEKIRNKFVNFVKSPFTWRPFSCKIIQVKIPRRNRGIAMSFFQKLGNALSRFMYGRNGSDQLGWASLVLLLVLNTCL